METLKGRDYLRWEDNIQMDL